MASGEQALRGLLGLALRAGRLAVGDHAVRWALRRGQAALVIVAQDAGRASRRRFASLAARMQVPLLTYGSKASLGAMVGRGACAVLAVTDEGLAAAVGRRLAQGSARPGAESGGEPFVTQHSDL